MLTEKKQEIIFLTLICFYNSLFMFIKNKIKLFNKLIEVIVYKFKVFLKIYYFNHATNIIKAINTLNIVIFRLKAYLLYH